MSEQRSAKMEGSAELQRSAEMQGEHGKAKGVAWRRLLSTVLLLPAWFAPHCKLRVLFHRWRGVKIGSNVEIGYFVLLDNVHPNLIEIEDDVVVTARATILAHDNCRYYTFGEPVKMGRTTIRRNAFIGIGAVVMPRVTIGESAIVGCNSVVTKDVADHDVVVGIPAAPLKRPDHRQTTETNKRE